MRKLALIVLAIGLLAAPAFAGTGNEAPSGAHLQPESSRQEHLSGDDLVGSNRHTILVQLNYSDPDSDNILGDDPGN